MATYEILDKGTPDGSYWGSSSTEKLGMYGVTPTTQYTACGAASTYVLLGQSTDTMTTYFLNSAAAVTSLVLQVSTLTAACRSFGLIL